MQFVKYFSKYILVVLLLANGTLMASVVEGKCGGTVFQIKISDVDKLSANFDFFYKINSIKKKLIYSTGAYSISVACIQSRAKHNLLLVEEVCSGSGCSDDGVYAVFDPNTKKMLIKFEPPTTEDYENTDYSLRSINELIRLYEKKNHDQVAELIGYTPPYLPDSKDTFCCDRSQY